MGAPRTGWGSADSPAYGARVRAVVRIWTLGVIWLGAAALPAQAQDLRGIVRDSATRAPVPNAVVTLLDSAGSVGARMTTDAQGQFRAVLSGDGARTVRVVRLGFRPRDARLPVPRDGVVRIDLAIVAIPIAMQTVHVAAGPACPRRGDRALALAVLEQARAGLLATVVARSDKPAHMTRLRATRFLDGFSDRIVHQRVRVDSVGAAFSSFGAALSVDQFLQHGFAADSAGLQRYYGPDAEVLLDDRFAATYCFHVAAPIASRAHQIGLAFRPPERREGRIDVDGTLWIDTVARALVDIEFRYLGTDPRAESFRPGGRISFRTMPNGVVVIDRWSIRIVGGRADARDVGAATAAGSDAALLANRSFYGVEVLGELAHARWADGATWTSPLGTLRLQVLRSDGKPAPGAVVRLADTDYEATADSNGHVGLTHLMPGPYSVATIDPDLAAIGVPIDSPLEFTAARGWTIITRLTSLELADYVSERCKGDIESWLAVAAKERPVWLLGRVVGPDGKPLSGASWTLRNAAAPEAPPLVTDRGVERDGTFQFCRLRLGDTVIVDVRARGMADARVPVSVAKQPTVVSVELKPRRP